MVSSTPCLVCGSNANFVKPLKANFLRDQLGFYYGKRLPGHVGVINYDMLRCTSCSMEFAWPMQPGSEEFYEWVSRQARYYPTSRWEWHVVVKKLTQQKSSLLTILDVGCGEGEFLTMIQQIPNVVAVGVDATRKSVAECRARNLQVYHGLVERYLEEPNVGFKTFDVITLFHCLEHVRDPKHLIVTLLELLKPIGKIIVSTPYSPMSFEGRWFDPLNHPPHHLTRWNLKAYQALAHQLGLKMEASMPAANTTVKRAVDTLNLAWNGPRNLVSRQRMMARALCRSVTLTEEWLRQKKREKVDGQTAADVILVEFSRN
jgi:2-polyprenyl-3-methyl-5-hydroxy-6-metoxy-1,4-benzoquinol methylase